MDIRCFDIKKLNSLTKYPSILTYHKMADRGLLVEEVLPAFESKELVYLTEKIDGTNGRIVALPDGDYLIGSREDLLTYSGDMIANPALGIVDALTPIAQRLASRRDGHGLVVFYLEVYGGRVGAAAKQYSGDSKVGARLFDCQVCYEWGELLELPIEKIASWRDRNHQSWLCPSELKDFADAGICDVVPPLAVTTADALPSSIADMADFLAKVIPTTKAGLDDGAKGRPEGFVVRNEQRSAIAKIRYEDYDRTIKALKKNAAK